MSINKEQVKTALAHVLHPEAKQDLISLDMIQDLIVQDKYISFTLEMPAQNDALASELKQRCEGAVHKFIDREAVVDIQVGINVSKRQEALSQPLLRLNHFRALKILSLLHPAKVALVNLPLR